MQARHKHLRKSVPREPSLAVTADIWIITDETTTEGLRGMIYKAAEAGAEVVTVDAGWYGAKGSRWFHTVGDYDDEVKRLHRGLAPVWESVRSKSMKHGLAARGEWNGGYVGMWGIYAPGIQPDYQADASDILSPQLYEEVPGDYDRKVLAAFPYNILHLHAVGLHIVDILPKDRVGR